MTRPTMASMAAKVADEWGVSVADIRGRSGKMRESYPRRAFYAMAKAEGFSLNQIGRFCSGRSHFTVWKGIERHHEHEGVAA